MLTTIDTGAPARRSSRRSTTSAAPAPKAARTPRPIPTMPDFSGMSAAERFAACHPALVIAKSRCLPTETTDHRFALLGAAWRILHAAVEPLGLEEPGVDIKPGSRSQIVMDACDGLERRIFDMAAERPEHLVIKRDIVAVLLRRHGPDDEQPAENADILATLREAIGMAKGPPAADETSMVMFASAAFRKEAQWMLDLSNGAVEHEDEDMIAAASAVDACAVRLIATPAATVREVGEKAAALRWLAEHQEGEPLKSDPLPMGMVNHMIESLTSDVMALAGVKPIPFFAEQEG